MGVIVFVVGVVVLMTMGLVRVTTTLSQIGGHELEPKETRVISRAVVEIKRASQVIGHVN